MSRLFELTCSTCHYRAAVKARSYIAAGEEFARCGWRTDGKTITCPSCVQRETALEEKT